MNTLILLPEDFEDDTTAIIKGDRFLHIKKILKSSMGDKISVGRLNGKMGEGLITDLSDDFLRLKVHLNQLPPDPIKVKLLLALPRPLYFKRILSALTSFGIKDIIIFHSKRVEKSYWQSPALHPNSIQSSFIAGLEQSNDTILPTISFERNFKDFTNHRLSTHLLDAQALLAHPSDNQEWPVLTSDKIVLAVGPEGGFIPEEVDMFQNLGFMSCSLGERILKVEHAVCALIGRLL